MSAVRADGAMEAPQHRPALVAMPGEEVSTAADGQAAHCLLMGGTRDQQPRALAMNPALTLVAP